MKALALAHGLAVLQPPTLKTDEARAPVTAIPLDVLVVAAYGLILPPAVLAWPRHGCLNIHASLLPRWRGAAPIQRALLAGDAETGVTIMQMDAGLDTGPMIEIVRVPIGAARHRRTLHDRLAAAGATRSSRSLARLERAGGLAAAPQPDEGATYAAKIARDERDPALGERRGGARPAGARVRPGAGRARRRSPASGQDLAALPEAAARRSGCAGDGARRRRQGHRRRLRRRACCASLELQPAGGRRMTPPPSSPVGAWPRACVSAPRTPSPRRRRESTAIRPTGRGDGNLRCRKRSDWPRWRSGGCSRARRCRWRWRRSRPRATRRAGAGGRWCRSSPTARCATGATLEALVRRLATKPFADPALAALVAVALYQLDHTRAPAFAVVDRAVAAAAEVARPAAKALVNALLRRYLREREALRRGGPRRPGRALVVSALVDRARRRPSIRTTGEAMLDAGNERPPLTLRVNVRVDDARRAARALRRGGRRRGARRRRCGIIVDPPRPVPALPGYADGAFSVQDLGAQLAAPLLEARRRAARARRLRRAGRQDHAPARARRRRARRARQRRGAAAARCATNLARLRLAGDARDGARRRRRRARRLVGRAAVRPHPRRRPVHGVGRGAPPSGRQVAAARDRHRGLRARSRRGSSTRSGRCLAPGGTLLYATCSVFDAENEAQVDGVRRARTRTRCAKPSPSPRRSAHAAGNSCLRSPGAGHNQDGFFYALLAQGADRRPRPRQRRSWPRRDRRPEPPHAAGSRRPPPSPACPQRPLPTPRRRRPPLRVRAGCCAGWRCVALAALAALAVAARADTIARQVGRAARRTRTATSSTPSSTSRSTPTLEEALQKGVPLYFVLEFELVAPALVLARREGARQRRPPVPRLLQRADAPVPGRRAACSRRRSTSLDEVERFLSRVTAPRRSRAATSSCKGARYEAAVRLRLDVNQLPKPFQVNALASREWTLQSDWYRWSFTP